MFLINGKFDTNNMGVRIESGSDQIAAVMQRFLQRFLHYRVLMKPYHNEWALAGADRNTAVVAGRNLFDEDT